MTPKKAEGPKKQPEQQAAAPVAAQQQGATKQQVTLDNLKKAWQARGVDLSKMEVKEDGKYMLVTVAANWPVVRLGANGGIDLPTIKSYSKAFDAAVHGDELLAKQTARTQKKAAPASAKPTPQPEAKKPESPTVRKARQHGEVEQRLQA